MTLIPRRIAPNEADDAQVMFERFAAIDWAYGSRMAERLAVLWAFAGIRVHWPQWAFEPRPVR